MARQEKEKIPSPVWPENFSPEIKRVLDKTHVLLTKRWLIETEVCEYGVAFNLKDFTQGMAKLSIFPKGKEMASVRLQISKSNRQNLLFESQEVRCRIINKGKTVFFESDNIVGLSLDSKVGMVIF
jgi:hypothetical protein